MGFPSFWKAKLSSLVFKFLLTVNNAAWSAEKLPSTSDVLLSSINFIKLIKWRCFSLVVTFIRVKSWIYIKINFTNYLHKLLSKAIRVLTGDSFVGSYRLFQAYSYLQCPFLTLALWQWSSESKNNWRQYLLTSTREKLWRCAWLLVRWQLRREKQRYQELKRNLNEIYSIFTPTQNSHENDKTGGNPHWENTSWFHVGVTKNNCRAHMHR